MHFCLALCNFVCLFSRERDYWHPGQTIPISAVPVSDVDYLDDTTVPTGPREQNTDVMDMLRSFHTSMEKNLSSISGKLESIDGRMNKLENQQKNLEDEVRSNVSSMTTNVCAKSPHTRARVTPTSLQVFVFAVLFIFVMCATI